ncbi:gametocyte-specific factor 1 [Melanotaenia boesemani]|uniref:gametocyte-specific factor 1 n=1 Tax=Melanotaenia boesemani TaxID=1250792 RepID=UPI001C043920|nr:gametocyte-specific factor 1 [Melanotaenia boesemani]XP_041860668.1 gametocyte-specific factor 1 [Melanotaenia boesemani]
MANTVRFGITTDPCRIASEKQEVEEYDEKANSDPEKLVQCPFDKNHQIRACRFPYHLIKCRKNHPKLANELKTCPFNARHLVPKHELAHHTETCEDRISMDTEDVSGNANGHREWHVPVSTWTNPNATEDWEQEADNEPTPFVWGVNTMLTQIPNARPTSSPGQSLRAPKNLPWSDF